MTVVRDIVVVWRRKGDKSMNNLRKTTVRYIGPEYQHPLAMVECWSFLATADIIEAVDCYVESGTVTLTQIGETEEL